jgi:hypothetical protein
VYPSKNDLLSNPANSARQPMIPSHNDVVTDSTFPIITGFLTKTAVTIL